MLISLVVTCYNRADMVCTALDSIWNQTYRPLELIVVDDGSTDNSLPVLRQWQEQHPDNDTFSTRILTFPNGRLCVARNRGLALVHGEYLQYVDDDDWLYPQAMERKAKALAQHPGIDLLVNQLDYMRKGKKIEQTHISLPVQGGNLPIHLLSHECLVSPTLMFRTETLRRIGAWKAGLIFGEDMEIVLRLALLGGTFALVDESLSAYRLHQAPRQCTTIRDRLPPDFCPQLYTNLYRLAKETQQDTLPLRQAFAHALTRDSVDHIHSGRFAAAQYCLQTAQGILQGQDTLPPLAPQPVPLSWKLQHLLWKGKRQLKAILR